MQVLRAVGAVGGRPESRFPGWVVTACEVGLLLLLVLVGQ
jgi:hypothetical protein